MLYLFIKILCNILFFWATSLTFSQTGGVESPGLYEFNVKDCFMASKYKGGIKKDSLKPNSIFKGQRIWRSINLERKQTDKVFISNSKCLQIGLFEIIKFGLLELKLNAFTSDNFNQVRQTVLPLSQIILKIEMHDTTEAVIFDSDGNEKKSITIEKRYLQNNDIKSFLLKEDWFISTISGKLEKRIIAIAPLIYDKRSAITLPLFWLYYNEWKEVFDLFEAKNYKDDKRISYAYALENQYFISIVSKESNIFGRPVNATNHSNEKGIESDVIKGKINNSESDIYPN